MSRLAQLGVGTLAITVVSMTQSASPHRTVMHHAYIAGSALGEEGRWHVAVTALRPRSQLVLHGSALTELKREPPWRYPEYCTDQD